MTRVLICLVLYACGGPTQAQLAETPTAQTKATPSTAPPASTSDKDRERSIQQFDDMEATQRAHAEARQESAPPPPKQSTKPAKKAPVEQAPVETPPK